MKNAQDTSLLWTIHVHQGSVDSWLSEYKCTPPSCTNISPTFGDIFQNTHQLIGDIFQNTHQLIGDIFQNTHQLTGDPLIIATKIYHYTSSPAASHL